MRQGASFQGLKTTRALRNVNYAVRALKSFRARSEWACLVRQQERLAGMGETVIVSVQTVPE